MDAKVVMLTRLVYEENPEWHMISKGRKSIGSNIFDKLPEIYDNLKDEDCIRIYRQNNERVYKWIKKAYVRPWYLYHVYFRSFKRKRGDRRKVLSTPLYTPLVGTPLVGHMTNLSHLVLLLLKRCWELSEVYKNRYRSCDVRNFENYSDNATKRSLEQCSLVLIFGHVAMMMTGQNP